MTAENKNVFQLRRPADRIWECHCGCQQFFFHENGAVQCANCKEISANLKCFAEYEQE